MLVARDPDGRRVEAAADLPRVDYVCPNPECAGPVILRAGRLVVPHFAHRVYTGCSSDGESQGHLAAKAALAVGLRALGWKVELEVPHPEQRRRIDLVVVLPGRRGGLVRVSVEIQASRIEVGEMIRREQADRALGYAGTCWVFTSERCPGLLGQDGGRVRVPSDVRFAAWSNGHRGVTVIHTPTGDLWNVALRPAWGSGGRLRATRTVVRRPAAYRLEAHRVERNRFRGWRPVFPDAEAGAVLQRQVLAAA